MHKQRTFLLNGKMLLIFWAILGVGFFVVGPAKISYVQWSDLSKWQELPMKLERLHPLRDFLNLLGSFAGTLLFSIACVSLGLFILRKSKIGVAARVETILQKLALVATGFLIGTGLLSIIFLTLASTYQLTPTYVIIILLASLLLGFRDTWKISEAIYQQLRSSTSETLDTRGGKLIIYLTIALLFISLFYSTARISYDATAIYFADAKLTAQAHHVQFFKSDVFEASVFQAVIPYAAMIELFGDQAARLFSWVCGIAVLIFSLALGESLGLSKRALYVLPVLLLTTTAFLDLLGDGKTDLLSSGTAIAAIYFVVLEAQSETENRQFFILAGLLAGTAVVERLFNGFLLGIFLVLFYLVRRYARSRFKTVSYKRLFSSLFWLGAGSMVLVLYHLFVNWKILGGPFAFLSSISNINPSAGPWKYDPATLLAFRLLYPFVVTFYSVPAALGNISPMFLAFLPSLLVPSIRSRIKFSKELKVLCVISAITLLTWVFVFFTIYEVRYVMFLWVILYLPVAEIIASILENEDASFRNIASGLIVVFLLFMIVRTVYISIDSYSPVDASGNPRCFCDFLDSVNQSASPGDRVLTLTTYRYYLRSDLFVCSTRHDEYKALQTALQKDEKAFWLEAYRQGYQYVVYEREYTSKHLLLDIIPGPENAPSWLHLERLYSNPDGMGATYKISVTDPPAVTQSSCKKNDEGIWQVIPAR